MEEKILTMHPEGKKDKRIDKKKYDTVNTAIIETLKAKGPLTQTGLTKYAGQKLGDKFEGSIPWYVETVKLDLEAKKIIERTQTKPLSETYPSRTFPRWCSVPAS
jgi:hypothetical protein